MIIKNLLTTYKKENSSVNKETNVLVMKKMKELTKVKISILKKGEKLTQLYFRSDVLLLKCVFETFLKVSINEFGINPHYFASLLRYTWQCALKCTGINLQTLQDKILIFNIRKKQTRWNEQCYAR